MDCLLLAQDLDYDHESDEFYEYSSRFPNFLADDRPQGLLYSMNKGLFSLMNLESSKRVFRSSSNKIKLIISKKTTHSLCLNRFMDFRLKSGSPKNRVSPTSAAMRKIYKIYEISAHRARSIKKIRRQGIDG